MTPNLRLRSWFSSACLSALLAAPVALAAPITAVPPAEYPGRPARAEAAVMLPPADVPALRIDLGVVAASEDRAVRAANAPTLTGKGRPLAIGFGRELGAAQRSIDLSRLTWQTGADGARHARIEIASPGAKAIRVALMLGADSAGMAFGFSGVGGTGTSFAASGSAIVAASADGLYWSPTIAGEVLRIDIRVAPGVALPLAPLVIPRVSHLLADGAELDPRSNKFTKGIGDSGSCNIDVACVVSVTSAFNDMTRAVVRITFVQDDGIAYTCTATLLNDSIQSFAPYLFAANHCINSARTARTINTYWFFEAMVCGGTAAGPYVLQGGGATLLGRSQDRDWALLRLNDIVPGGAYFAGWRAEPLEVNAMVSTIHHPRGDLKKWSQGRSLGDAFVDYDDALGIFSDVTWQQGTTEGGSSGSPLLTFQLAGGFYEVRGGLFGGSASCSNLGGIDTFSQLQASVPLVRQYLTPDGANPGGQVAATEFYNRTLDHYFLSTNPAEIASLDSGATRGWDRTGFRFLVYNTPVAGANPVCRFYRAPAYGDSHFYSASPAECASTAALHPVDWIYESPNVFYAALPDTVTGACAVGMSPVYRFFNVSTTNHRYTAELTLRNELAVTPGWVAEGYGNGPYYPVMCAVAP